MAMTSQGELVEVNTWANGLMFDFGLGYNTGFRTVRLGVSVQNFGADVTYAEEHNPIPLALRVGVAADMIGANALSMESEQNRVTLAFDLFQPNDYEQQMHMGMEYAFSDIAALRVGYKVNYDADGFVAGVGFKQDFGGMRLSFDYSYGAMSYNIGNVHRISLGAGF